MKKFFSEFQTFISRGNVLDLAVGVIIGGAFTAIVTSVVEDFIMPLISLITGGLDFNNWNVALGAGTNPPILKFGSLAAAVLNFLLIALVLFLVIKGFNRLRRTKETAAEEPANAVCPFCKGEVALDATRCPHCTSFLNEEAEK